MTIVVEVDTAGVTEAEACVRRAAPAPVAAPVAAPGAALLVTTCSCWLVPCLRPCEDERSGECSSGTKLACRTEAWNGQNKTAPPHVSGKSNNKTNEPKTKKRNIEQRNKKQDGWFCMPPPHSHRIPVVATAATLPLSWRCGCASLRSARALGTVAAARQPPLGDGGHRETNKAHSAGPSGGGVACCPWLPSHGLRGRTKGKGWHPQRHQPQLTLKRKKKKKGGQGTCHSHQHQHQHRHRHRHQQRQHSRRRSCHSLC